MFNVIITPGSVIIITINAVRIYLKYYVHKITRMRAISEKNLCVVSKTGRLFLRYKKKNLKKIQTNSTDLINQSLAVFTISTNWRDTHTFTR